MQSIGHSNTLLQSKLRPDWSGVGQIGETAVTVAVEVAGPPSPGCVTGLPSPAA